MKACQPTDPLGGAQSQADFARLFVKHQRMLFGYLVNLLGSVNDAEEVLQETSVVLWREQEQFTAGTNFAAWACRVAFHQVQGFRRKRKRHGTLLESDLLDQIAAEGAERWTIGEQRREALQGCLQNLPSRDREMVAVIYGEAATMVQAAEVLGRPLNTVYKGIQRIRRVLLECIERAIRSEDRP